MTLVELDEPGPPVELPLTLEQGRLLASSGVVSAGYRRSGQDPG